MSTRETPAEARLAESLTPSRTAVPTTGLPSPGIALAAARVPGSPTLPDWDPASMAVLMTRMASQLLVPEAAPPMSPAAGVHENAMAQLQPPAPPVLQPAQMPTQGGMPVGGMPVGGMPVGGTPPAEVPEQGRGPSLSPFSAPIDFTALLDSALQPAATFPLIDGPEEIPAPTSAQLPSQTEAAAPVTAVEPSVHPSAREPFDPQAIRREFPILQERVNGKRLVWLDNAATTQKPQAVIDRLKHYYEHENSNIHRAAHTLAARASDAYEGARESVRRFIHAPSVKDIVFLRGATEAINLVAQTWGRRNVGAGDEILITWLEHHANIVPWHRLCQETGAKLRVAPVDDTGQILLDEYQRLVGPRTKLVALPQVSNALGTVTPAAEMIEIAHRHGAKVLLDGAQSVSHMPVDVQDLDCDFFVFSGHKIFAPTGIGALYGKAHLLEDMPPWQGGGNMIQDVTFDRVVYQPPPARFEAGTGNIADAIGLGAALDWLSRVGVHNVGAYEHELLEYGTDCLMGVPGLKIIGTAPGKAGVISFVLEGQKTEELSAILDKEGIAVRSGHHCAQPILRRFGVEATVRASLAPYNGKDDLDALTDALKRLQAGRASR